MANRINQKNSASRKRAKSYQFYIQPIWKIHGLCDTCTVDSDEGPGRFPPHAKLHTSVLEEVLKHKQLSPEGLAYYAYWIVGKHSMRAWGSLQQQELCISTKQVTRLRQELRAAGLLTMTRAGRRTYSCIHYSPVAPEDRKEIAESYALAIKAQWGIQQKYRLEGYADTVTPFFSRHTGAVAGKTIVVFRASMQHAASDLLLRTRGMNRLRALGLWLLLCNKQDWYNWRTPGHIAKELGFSKDYVLKHFAHLLDLKLVYYMEQEKMIGVSRFPEGVQENLHPINCEHSSTPWKQLRQGGM